MSAGGIPSSKFLEELAQKAVRVAAALSNALLLRRGMAPAQITMPESNSSMDDALMRRSHGEQSPLVRQRAGGSSQLFNEQVRGGSVSWPKIFKTMCVKTVGSSGSKERRQTFHRTCDALLCSAMRPIDQSD